MCASRRAPTRFCCKRRPSHSHYFVTLHRGGFRAREALISEFCNFEKFMLLCSSRRSIIVTDTPHARPAGPLRSAKPTDPTHTLSHGPAARSVKPTVARPSPKTRAPERRAGRYAPPIALRSARRLTAPTCGSAAAARSRPVARVARHALVARGVGVVAVALEGLAAVARNGGAEQWRGTVARNSGAEQ